MVAARSILIVEDDPLLSNNMALILTMEGFDARVAVNGLTALDMMRSKRPDLILCDVLMPGMDGHAFHEAIKKEPDCGNILFIFVSALSDREQIRRGMLAGADDYLPKPFSAQELLAAVTARLQRVASLRSPVSPGSLSEPEQTLLKRISPREREVLALVAQGATSKEIAGRLFISPKTVEVHRAQLMKKLGAANAAALSRWADLLKNADKPAQ